MMASTLPMPPCLAFESLSHIVLDLVCDYLVAEERDRCNLFAFSLTSKLCCQIATRLRFERIHLSVRDPQQLEQIISEFDDVLRVGERHRHVRKTKITGYMNLEGEETSLTMWVRTFWDGIDMSCGSEGEWHGDSPGMTFSKPPSLVPLVVWEPIITPEEKTKRNELWKPLVAFLTRLPGLKHLIWASTDQMPRCILNLLHTHFPSGNLHINTFSLRSLYQQDNVLYVIDDDEYALATSQCLSSISAASSDSNHEDLPDFTEEAILQMVIGMAPNLRSVCMWYLQAAGPRGTLQAPRTLRAPWRGFVAGHDKGEEARTSISQLRSLNVRAETRTSSERWQNWSRHIDFTRLHSLSFDNYVDKVVLQTLIDMAKSRIFHALQSFSLHVGKHDPELQLTSSPEQAAIATLLSALKPLQSLHISGQIGATIKTSILGQHGASLYRLHLPTVIMSRNEVVAVAKKCSNIRSLQLGIYRARGPEEVQLYRSLGSMPHLSDLTIKMSFDNEHACIDEHFGATEYNVTLVERVHSDLMDSAIDSDLAQSIFHTILSANLSIRLKGIMPSFESLEICTDYCTPADLGKSFKMLQNWIARGWMCKRKLSDADNLDIIVREIGKEGRRNPDDSCLNYGGQHKPLCSDLDLYKPMWDAVWPEAKGRKDWTNVWHSFPL